MSPCRASVPSSSKQIAVDAASGGHSMPRRNSRDHYLPDILRGAALVQSEALTEKLQWDPASRDLDLDLDLDQSRRPGPGPAKPSSRSRSSKAVVQVQVQQSRRPGPGPAKPSSRSKSSKAIVQVQQRNRPGPAKPLSRSRSRSRTRSRKLWLPSMKEVMNAAWFWVSATGRAAPGGNPQLRSRVREADEAGRSSRAGREAFGRLRSRCLQGGRRICKVTAPGAR